MSSSNVSNQAGKVKKHQQARNNNKKQAKAASAPQNQSQKSARRVALDILVKVEQSGAYSNLQLNRSLQEHSLSRQDAALVTELVYGTISRKLTIDYWLAQLISKGLNKLEPWVHQLLRMSVYQLLWLDRIPAHAAVNEAVNIAKKKGHQGISGMVNGVLRNVLRRQQELTIDAINIKDPAEALSVKYSFPLWLVKRWIAAYGNEVTEQLLISSNEPPHHSLRINTMKTTVAEMLKQLQDEGISAAASPLAAAGINVDRGGNLAQHPNFQAGLWSMQDESSMLVAEALQPSPGMVILDACAAPGGKSMHIGELMKGKGKLLSNDLHEHKRKLIAEQAERLGLTHIETSSGDAVELAERLPQASFDAVLLDAPCSGLGVIRRKPEIKWSKSDEDITAIAKIQAQLLEAISGLVKPGGVLVYSTCTIAPEENEDQVAAFLSKHPEYELAADWSADLLQRLRKLNIINEDFAGQLQLMPYHAGSDGFYIARLRRVKN